MNIRTFYYYFLRRPLKWAGIHICRDHKYPICTGSLLDLVVPMLVAKYLNPVFCQIGASDGEASDPLVRLIERYNLKGLLVEPLPCSFELLSRKYRSSERVACVNCAISEHGGDVTFFCPRGIAKLADFQKSGLKKDSLLQAGIPESEIEEINIPSKSLAQLFEEYDLKTVHLLQIDVEGFDFEIVKQAFNLANPPPVIHFETIHLSRADKLASRLLLKEKGYYLVETETDTLACQLDAIAACIQ